MAMLNMETIYGLEPCRREGGGGVYQDEGMYVCTYLTYVCTIHNTQQ